MGILGQGLLAEAGAVHSGWLTGRLLAAVGQGAEWVLWILVFLRRVAADTETLRLRIIEKLTTGDVDGLVESFRGDESMQAHVVAYGLREAERGAAAVEDLCRGALGVEQIRYERGLALLASIGSNAPFIGLFGTVIGVIMAFEELRGIGGVNPDSSAAVMGAIAEALIATGVGLLVAIPAIVFFNLLKARVKRVRTATRLLVDTCTAYLRSAPPGAGGS